MPVQKMKPIEIFVPFSKIERRESDDALIVEGYCYVNPIVKGDRWNLKRAAMEAATPEYEKFPAVREMHQAIAAGTGLEVVWDERGCLLRSECVDRGTREKIEKKVLRGYSVGVNPLTMRGDDVESCDWVETSYVDRPKDPDAVFLFRAEGWDPDAEVEVTVLEESPATPPAEDEALPPSAAAAAEGVEAPATVPPPDAAIDEPGIAATSQEPDAGGADLSPERDAVRVALIAQGISETRAAEMAAEVEIAAPEPSITNAVSTDTLTAYPGTAGNGSITVNPGATDHGSVTAPLATETFTVPVQERAQSSATVPVRENLDKLRPATPQEVNSELSEPPRGEYRVEQAPTGMWCVYGPDGEKLGEFESEAAANARVAEVKAAMSDTPTRAAAVEDTPPAAEQLVARLAEMRAEMDRFEALLSPPPAPNPQQLSGEQPDEATALARVELSRVLRVPASENLELNRLLGAATKRIRELEDMPVREKPVVRYPHALSREFLVNLGSEDEAEVARLRTEFAEAKAAAEAARDSGDRDKRDREMQRMMVAQGELSLRGVIV